ncbi:MAG: hypothetical protein CMI36_15985 [Owenweeksia sp.]|nr:hypothetical protein [Owenweeksia sp.]MBG00491.1 hypothetical protein [Owenweeksia sp.]|tara:strand:+ start:1380 stop:2567 length:1188 start_codon:yes stop_codon:yes gene_type:complete
MKDHDEIDQLFQKAFRKAEEPFDEKYWEDFYETRKGRLVKQNSRSWLLWSLIVLIVGILGVVAWFGIEAETPNKKEVVPLPFEEVVPKEKESSQQTVSSVVDPTTEVNREQGGREVYADETAEPSPFAKIPREVTTYAAPKPDYFLNKNEQNAQGEMSRESTNRASFMIHAVPRDFSVGELDINHQPGKIETKAWPKPSGNTFFTELGIRQNLGASGSNSSGLSERITIGVGYVMNLAKRQSLVISFHYTQRGGSGIKFNSEETYRYLQEYKTLYEYELDHYQSLDLSFNYRWQLSNRASLQAGLFGSFLLNHHGSLYRQYSYSETEKEDLGDGYDPGMRFLTPGAQLGVGYILNPFTEVQLNYRHSATPVNRMEYTSSQLQIHELILSIQYKLN